MILCASSKTITQTRKPRASGDDPRGRRVRGQFDRVNPARAGMILPTCDCGRFVAGKPRASGDDPTAIASDSGVRV